ncbi:hypothetical protein MCEMSE6_00723 [Oxalobacteraceae bacterium]
MGSESLIGKPSENEVNLSSKCLGSVGSEMNYFLISCVKSNVTKCVLQTRKTQCGCGGIGL